MDALVRALTVSLGRPEYKRMWLGEYELEARQNELYEAMRVVEEMPASEAQTACIVKLAERMAYLVAELGKSEVARGYVPAPPFTIDRDRR